jgi:autotransporter-associated beta strand protein
MQTLCPPQTIWADRIRAARKLRRTVVVSAATVAVVLGWAAPAQAQRVLGIDVSAWQGNLSTTNWATLKRPTDQQVGGVFGDGRDFVFIRSSRGGTTGYYDQNDSDNSNGLNTLSQRYDDPYYVQNITRATAAGMFAGSYHFSRPDIIASTLNSGGIPNNGTDEANHFIQMAGPWMRPGFLLPVHDFEAGDGARTSDQMAQFVIDFSDRIYAVMGIRPIIYVNGNYAANILGTASLSLRTQVVAGNLLWSARWPNQADPGSIPVQTGHPKDSYAPIYGPWDDPPNPVNPWKFWQYASTARLNGYASGTANIDVDVAQGGMEFLKDQLVPALWVTNSSGQWTTLTNWNSGLTPTAPVQGPGQVPRVGPMTLPAERLPEDNDTVILDRPSASITVTLASGTHTIRKLYVRETLNITGGSLTVGYVPSADSTPIAAQFSGPVTLNGSGSLSIHTLQVDATQAFTVGGGTLTFNTIKLMPHATTPAKILMAGDAIFSGLSGTNGTIANGTGSGSSGFVDLGGATRTFDVVNVVFGTDLSVNVPITNGALNKIGAGTLALNAVNTYSGTTTVQGGRIELAGALNGSVLVSEGVFALGTSTGIRTVNGSFGVNSGGTLRVRLNGPTAGTEYDRVSLTNATSTVTLSGTLDIIAAPSLAVGSTFRVIENSGSAAVSGTFAGLPQNAEFYEDGQWWRISYTGGTGNDVVLTRIAETPWHSWQLANFPADVNNPAIAGDYADFEKDGVVNRLEYAFGSNPTVIAQTPLTQLSIIGGRLAITFTRVVANADLTITVQGADSPTGPWTNLASSVGGATTSPLLGGVIATETGTGATRSVEVRDLYLTTDSLHPARFLRVQVTWQ